MPRAKLNGNVLKAMIRCGPEKPLHVRYWPVWKLEAQAEFKDGVIIEEPWMTGSGEWIVKIPGISGGVAVSHCALLPIQGDQGPRYESD